MKELLATVALWAVLLMPTMNGQSYVDTIRVVNRDMILAKVMHPNIHKLKTQQSYKDLIQTFKIHLESIKEQIPDYLNYQIIYYKDQNLKVEEITGVTKYKVEDGKVVTQFSPNVARLYFGKLKIELFFTELEELFELNYITMIENALVQLKNRKKMFVPWTMGLLDNYTYSYTTNNLVKGDGGPRKRNKIGLVIDSRWGVNKNKPIYEIGYGIGYAFGQKNQIVLYAFSELTYQYRPDRDITGFDFLWGMAFRNPKMGSVHLAFPLTRNFHFSNLLYRLGVTSYLPHGFSITAYFYQDRINDTLLPLPYPGVSVGYVF